MGKNERHFNVDFRFEIRSVVIGHEEEEEEEEEEESAMDHRKGLLFDVVEKLYTREEQDRWWKRNTEFAPLCVAKVTTGADHSVAISTDQRVWTCGSNSHGQLGHGPQVRNVSTFCLVEALVVEEGILTVSAGYAHSVAVGRDGGVFTWGLGLAGRLGHGSEEPEFFPRSVDELKGKSVIQVTSGGGHSAALTLNGMVYTFGYGVRGQLGHGKDVLTQWTPRLVEALCRCWVVKVTARATAPWCSPRTAGCYTSVRRCLEWRETMRTFLQRHHQGRRGRERRRQLSTWRQVPSALPRW